ncbi:ankyrin repeat-containing domain protein [Phaeosphaeriaceae sp. PMI808]|nr:ankyrin repeat-containing domain protein [Phaeosphaeriaceae sp. PMI808]
MAGTLPEDIESSDDQKQDLRETHSVEPEPLHDRDLPVHKAAYKGNNAQVMSLITSGVNINARSIFECTPLQLAICGDHAETVRILLSAGADAALPDSIEPCMMAPFDAINGAAWLGARHALGALIDFGVKTPASALCWTASLNRVDCMRTILEKLGQNDFSDLPRPEGLSAALNRAALCWHVEGVELVLVHVKRILADSVSEDRSYLSSALVSAAREFDCDDRCRQDPSQPGRQSLVMQNLITAGADVNWEHPELGLTAFWATLDSPFIPKDIVRLLLKSGLQLCKSSVGSRTPLFGIIVNFHDDASLVEAFLEAGAKATVKDANLDTPLHFAAHLSFAKLLFKYGADLFAKDLGGRTPLHTACEDWRLDVVEFLLSKGAIIDKASTEKQWTPLLFATYPKRIDTWIPYPERHEQVVKLLLARGANVQVTALDGRTVLHNTARTGDADLVRSVVEHGTDVCAVTSDGETALHSVCDLSSASNPKMAQRLAIIHILLDHGANVNARDQTGSTPLHASWSCAQYSSRFGPDLFNLLLKKVPIGLRQIKI